MDSSTCGPEARSVMDDTAVGGDLMVTSDEPFNSPTTFATAKYLDLGPVVAFKWSGMFGPSCY